MKVKDLTDQTGTADNRILFCYTCGNESSANAEDYFLCNGEEEFTCCGEPMIRVRKKVVYEEC